MASVWKIGARTYPAKSVAQAGVACCRVYWDYHCDTRTHRAVTTGRECLLYPNSYIISGYDLPLLVAPLVASAFLASSFGRCAVMPPRVNRMADGTSPD